MVQCSVVDGLKLCRCPTKETTPQGDEGLLVRRRLASTLSGTHGVSVQTRRRALSAFKRRGRRKLIAGEPSARELVGRKRGEPASPPRQHAPDRDDEPEPRVVELMFRENTPHVEGHLTPRQRQPRTLADLCTARRAQPGRGPVERECARRGPSPFLPRRLRPIRFSNVRSCPLPYPSFVPPAIQP